MILPGSGAVCRDTSSGGLFASGHVPEEYTRVGKKPAFLVTRQTASTTKQLKLTHYRRAAMSILDSRIRVRRASLSCPARTASFDLTTSAGFADVEIQQNAGERSLPSDEEDKFFCWGSVLLGTRPQQKTKSDEVSRQTPPPALAFSG